jgi:hypothetical protein
MIVSQLPDTMRLKTLSRRLPHRAGRNPRTVNPRTIAAASISIKAFTTRRNRPSVRRVSGSVRKTKTGRTMALAIPNTSAPNSAARPSATSIPFTIFPMTIRRNAVRSR